MVEDSLVDLARRTCAAHPDALVADGVGGPLRFGELWDRSAVVAGDLVALGVRPEDHVGIWAVQSSELLVGILGILRAGAAYVPLEPTLPERRLALIVADAGLSVIVAPSAQAEAAASIVPTVVASDRTGTAAPSPGLPAVHPSNAAYVIYTSGSTGQPKGVVIEHGSVVGMLEWTAKEFPISVGDRLMGTASPAFDASVPMLLLPLATGATFVPIEPDRVRDPMALAGDVAARRPSVLVVPPTMLRMLMETRWPGDPALVVWTGGERTAPEVIAYVADRVATFANWYGPTEATVQVAMARLGADDAESPVRTSPDHTSCVVVDESLHEVPDGTEGELVLVGRSLARGYLSDEGLTKERFVTVELDGRPVRAYRTGDLACRTVGGDLLLLGRIDDQLNVHGHRVEPREVEDALRSHAGVLEAIVVAPDDGAGDRPLVAYVRARGDVSSAELRGTAQERLPSHMVPLVVLVDTYPLSSTGKVDRRRLAALAAEHEEAPLPPQDAEALANATELERTIVSIFAEVLGLGPDRVGLDDDFFDLGGTSLRSLRLFMQIEARLSVRLALSTLTTASTPRRLAELVAAEQPDEGDKAPRGEEPQHEWERILSAMWRDVLHRSAVTRDESFFDLGGTPADARRMLDRLASLYGVEVSTAEFEERPTIRELAAVVGERTRRSILVPLTTSGDRPPLFLIAGAGGLAVTFLPLARLLGGDQPVYGLQARGIERRAVPDLTFRQHTMRYARTIRAVQRHGPYLLGGHSLGGVHALHVAQHLVSEGEEVALLAIFDAQLTRRMMGKDRLGDRTTGAVAEPTLPRGLPRLRTVLHLPFVGIVPFRGTAQFEAFAGLGELQAAACGRLESFGGRTVVFLSDDDESVLVEERWGQLLTGPWRSARVPGGHIAMLEQANIASAAVVLRAELDAVLGAGEPS